MRGILKSFLMNNLTGSTKDHQRLFLLLRTIFSLIIQGIERGYIVKTRRQPDSPLLGFLLLLQQLVFPLGLLESL